MPLKRGEAREGYVIEHPNRQKAASKMTKFVIVILLLVSAGLMAIVTVGGWDTLVGAKALQIAYILLYLGMAFLVLRWNRGILPVAAALAIILMIFAFVSAPEWTDRNKDGFTNPALDEPILAMVTWLIVPAQILLIGFAMRGFQQAWNVEVERPADGRSGQGSGGNARAQAQPA